MKKILHVNFAPVTLCDLTCFISLFATGEIIYLFGRLAFFITPLLSLVSQSLAMITVITVSFNMIPSIITVRHLEMLWKLLHTLTHFSPWTRGDIFCHQKEAKHQLNLQQNETKFHFLSFPSLLLHGVNGLTVYSAIYINHFSRGSNLLARMRRDTIQNNVSRVTLLTKLLRDRITLSLTQQ